MSEFSYRDAHNAVFSSGLGIYTKMVMLQIIDHLPNPRPGINRIAARCSMSRDQAMDEIKSLEAMGVLTVTRRFGQGNEYRLADGWMNVLPVDTNHRRTGTTGGRQPLPPVDGNHGGGGSQPLPPVDTSHSNTEVKTETKTEEEKTCATAAPPAPVPAPGFSLKPPKTETEKPKATAKPEHQAVIDHWFSAYERQYGEKPIALTPVEAKDVKRLLDALKRDGAKACELIDNAFTDPWFQSKGTISYLASHPAKYQQPYKEPASTRKMAAPQMGMADDIASDESGFDDAPPPSASKGKVIDFRKAGTR